MPALNPALLNKLETDIIRARAIAERAAKGTLERLAVHEPGFYPSMNDEQRALRRTLRTKARQLGDATPDNAQAELSNLVRECAYEAWHQMLFAKFLLENDLLMHPEGVAVSFEECADLAREEGDADAWATAARYASHMLPGIFRPGDPLLQVRFALEDRRALEAILEGIPRPTFTSDDGLGWVYQFWQTQAKKDVNQSGRKIGGADLPAVTQLFTEHYMVQFLLHNTLGAWWAARHPDISLPTEKSYLRTLEDGTPAAGRFKGWPDRAKDLRLIDPCCGSGHFLVAAFALLTRMRMLEEGLSEREAGDAVLRDNLHGLELDPRCTQLAAFNLALEAWKWGGYRTLPPLNVACSGVSVGGREDEWTKLANGDARAASSLRRLYTLFKNAPDLGSLIDPTRLGADDPLYSARYDEVEALLERALARAKSEDDPASAVFGETAKGVTSAARLLRGTYHLVVTNVPYLGRGKQGNVLKSHIERMYPNSRADLATAFIERCLGFAHASGTTALVSPQNWWFQSSYKKMRTDLLSSSTWRLGVPLGEEAWTSFGIRGPRTSMMVIENANPNLNSHFMSIETSRAKSLREIESAVLHDPLIRLEQTEQLRNPDSIVMLSLPNRGKLLGDFAKAYKGLSTSDDSQFVAFFWEIPSFLLRWEKYQSSSGVGEIYGGCNYALRYEEGQGRMRVLASLQGRDRGRDKQGSGAWGKQGVTISKMRGLFPSLYLGAKFDAKTAPIIPFNQKNLTALWAFCSSDKFKADVKKLNQSVSVETGYFLKVPFDLEHWQKVAAEKYPDGLPEPYSADPTQWLFNGAVLGATEPLQVAVARLLGYAWPEQGQSTDKHPFPERETDLSDSIDEDGIMTLHGGVGQRPAAERLRGLLERVYGEPWSAAQSEALLGPLGYGGKDLHEWLRDGFFAQHCRVFGNRPFIWHVWDGRKDGFSALVNYHKLTRSRLERLIYTYLGDYLSAQARAAGAGERGADLRLAAAQDLKGRLESILHGEKPFDIYVRWKPLHEQPLGWEPDLNDGVRLNVRPFVTAGVLRSKFTVHWNKDRGTNPDGSERLNDVHLALLEKQESRKQT